jgi:Prokaryotic homologs of the JAB domain
MDGVNCVTLDRVVIHTTLQTLKKFGARGEEGLVLWLGRIEPGHARVSQVYVPHQSSISDENGMGYFVSGETLFELNKTLAESGLRLIAQVHSHPGEAYHSHADDRYAIVTVEGGLSIVVPDFGDAPAEPAAWAVYRLSSGKWRELGTDEIRALIRVGGLQ